MFFQSFMNTISGEMCHVQEGGMVRYEINQHRYDASIANATCTVDNFPLDLNLNFNRYYGYGSNRVIRVIIQSTNTRHFNRLLFDQQQHLEMKIYEIYMENLDILELSSETFARWDFLKIINLARNDLTLIENGTFSSLPSLEYVDISMNALKNISPFAFMGPMNLKFLNLSHNFLKFFDMSSISVAKQLNLDLSFNNLTRFDFQYAAGKVEVLNLSHNSLTEIKDCFPTFKIINLSHNHLKSSTNVNCFTKYDETVYLNLGDNYFSELQPELFHRMSKLETLYVDRNNLTFLSIEIFSRLHSLKILSVSHNHLKEFQHGLFEHMENLEVFDVSHNQLTDIDSYVHSLTNLKRLWMDNNRVEDLDAQQLLNDLPNLQNISLDHNLFSCQKLIGIFRSLKKKNISVPFGEEKADQNVHGIKCDDSLPNEKENGSEILKKVERTILEKMAQYEGKFSTSNTSLTEYFNHGFKNTDLYNHLRNLSGETKYNFNESEFVNYFDKDFKNSTFFKYLEELKDHEIASADLNRSFYKFFNDDFKNSTFVKYFEDLTSTDKAINDNFMKSKMFNFFNGDFQNSNFYKYLENFKSVIGNFRTENDINSEKLVRSPSGDNSDSNGTIVIFFLSILILMVGCLVFIAVKMYAVSLKNNAIRPEQVELFTS